MRALAIVCVLASVAGAEPKKDAAAALKKGRELQHKKKYADALAAFEQGLAAMPDDAVLDSEAGWTAYLLKDYDKAQELTRKALALEATPAVRAASLYNLGLIAEAKGDRTAAAGRYGESLRLRPNATVRKALLAIDPGAAAQFDPFAPQKLAGPFDSIAAFCKTQPAKEVESLDGLDMPCTCGTLQKPEGKVTLGLPFEKVEVFRRQCIAADSTNGNGGIGDNEYRVAVKTANGWYVGQIESDGFNRHCATDFKLHGASVEQHGPLLALVRFGLEGGCGGGLFSNEFTGERVVAVAVGPSGVPSATPAVRTKEHDESTSYETDPEKTTVNVDLALAPAWSDGKLELEGKAKGANADEVGAHAVVFP